MNIVRFAIALMLMLSAQAGWSQDKPTPPPFSPIEIGTSYRLQSQVLGDVRELNVWLPTDYEKSNDRYPVVYLLDGGLDQDFQHIAGLGHLASLSWTYGPVIIVGIQTKDRRAELTSRATDVRYIEAFPQSGGADRFRQFIRREVIPFVESRFRTNERRALMGESLAGLFVIDTMLNEPALFKDYIAISPSLWWDDRRPLRNLDRNAKLKGLADTRLYLAVADEGGTMQDGVDRLRSVLGTLPVTSIALRYADLSASATHSTIYHRAAEDALRWLYPMPPYPSDPTPWYMVEGAAPERPKVEGD